MKSLDRVKEWLLYSALGAMGLCLCVIAWWHWHRLVYLVGELVLGCSIIYLAFKILDALICRNYRAGEAPEPLNERESDKEREIWDALICGRDVVPEEMDDGQYLAYMMIKGKPTYTELLKLNPRVGNHSQNEIESLLDTILECGYRWEGRKGFERFYNAEISQTIWFGDLHLFTPETFREHHRRKCEEHTPNE